MSEYHLSAHSKSTNVRMKMLRKSSLHTLLGFLWYCAPGISHWLVQRQFFAPRPYKTRPEEEQCLRRGEPFQIRVHDKTIKAWKWGDGPGVLLVHGWSGRGVQFHRFVEPLVASGYTAIALDGPAHGESSGRVTNYFEMTDTVRAFLSKRDELDIQGIVAHSLGAAAVINALEKETQALSTVCIAPVLSLPEILFKAFDQYGIPQRVYESLLDKLGNRFGYNLMKDSPNRLLGHLSGSVLIVHDRKDMIAPFRDSYKQSRKHDHVTLYETKGLGHKRVLSDERVIESCLDHIG